MSDSVPPVRPPRAVARPEALLEFDRLVESATSLEDFAQSLLSPAERRLLVRCAVPRRFNQALVDAVLRPDAGVDERTVSFERLTALPGVGPDSGQPGWFFLTGSARETAERPWQEPPGEPGSDSPGPERYRALSESVAQWFEATGAWPAEVLYNRLGAGSPAARDEIKRLFEQAELRFDLAQCDSLLQMLSDHDRAGRLDADLAAFRTTAQGLLAARRAAADDYYQSARYLERAALRKAFDDILKDPTHHILLLHGPGGQGKTMFLRWLTARYCLQQRIPIARVDFDFLDESESGLKPRFFFGKLAEQLDAQIPGGVFGELLNVVAEMRREATGRRAGPAADSADVPIAGDGAADEADVVERFASVLEEKWRGPVVLVFDTLEEARFKHNINLLAIVSAVEDVRRQMAERSTRAHRVPPRIVLLLSGRHPLEDHYPEVVKQFGHAVLEEPVTPFDRDESRVYLRTNRGLKGKVPALGVAIARAGGSPFKLALYADVLIVNPKISKGELERRGDIDVLYLVERVLKRIPDFAMRWVLRYGGLVRSLTRRTLEDVLGPHLIRAMHGDRQYDDPAVDQVEDEGWPILWKQQEAAARLGVPDYDGLWARLRDYASASSWISVDKRAVDALAIQPVVSHPLRRVLREQPVFQLIHRSAIAALRSDLPRPGEGAGDRLAALTYHEFQLRGSGAAPVWATLLDEYADDAAAVRVLASVVLSEDLLETEAVGDAPALVTPAVKARARLELARAGYMDSLETTGEERQQRLSAARQRLREFDAMNVPADQLAIPAAIGAALRWNLAEGKEAREAARATLVQTEQALGLCEKGGIDVPGWNPLLLALQSAFGLAEPERANQYTSCRARLAQQAGDAAIYGDAIDWLLSDSLRRGAIAEGLKSADRALVALRESRWSAERAVQAARDRIYVRWTDLEIADGWPSRAMDPPQFREPRKHDASFEVLLTPVRLALAGGRAATALQLAAEWSKYLQERIGLKSTARLHHEWQVSALTVQQLSAAAETRLMNFGEALDTLQDVIVRADVLQEPTAAVACRLEKGRIYLQEIGDLKQAAEHLGSRTTVADQSPEVRLRHVCLIAELQDRSGFADGVDGAVLEAEQLLADLPATSVGPRVRTALTVLALRHTARRLHHLGLLADALATIDSVGARLACLGDLNRCAVIEAVSPALRAQLRDLVDDAAEPVPPPATRDPGDHLRLQLCRVELLRVLDLQDRARTELADVVKADRQASLLQYRKVALLCDRLEVSPADLLSRDWLAWFTEEMKLYDTLVGAALLEQAEREFRQGSSATARAAVARARQRLEHSNKVRSTLDRRLLLLEAALARENHQPDAATELEARAAKVSEELGEPSTRSTPLVSARAEAWSSQLGAASVFAVHFEGAEQGTLLSWSNGATPVGRTPRPLAADLRVILEALLTTPLGGQASSPLRHWLFEVQSNPGQPLGQWLLPGALQQAIGGRIAVSPSGSPPDGDPVELVVSSVRAPFHAVPWELTVIGGPERGPVVFEPNVRHVSRTTDEPSPGTRVQWAQRALAIVLDSRVLADGTMGPLTARAIQKAQQMFHLPTTGLLDGNTRRALRDAVREKRPGTPPARVLLLESTREEQITVQRGGSGRGADVFRAYRRAGVPADVLNESNPKLLSEMLARGPGLVHIAAPIVESRSGGELSVQLGTNTRNVSVTALSAPALARMLKSASQDRPAPMVLLDVPRPPTLEEALRQLIFRNVFAAHLFSLGALPAVIAAGLGTIEDSLDLSEAITRAVQERLGPGDFAAALRRAPYPSADPGHRSLEHALSSTCVALFARDPELGPDDLSRAGVV